LLATFMCVYVRERERERDKEHICVPYI